MISAAVIMIGFIANYLFKKTQIPDTLILIFVGALCGPILGVFNPDAIQSFAPYIAALALVYILFDGGMGLTFSRVLDNSLRAVILATTSFIISMIATAIVTVIVFGIPLLYGLLLGGILGGNCSVTVISLASKLKMSDKASTTLILESAITDILAIVISLSIIGVIINGQTNYASIIVGVGGKFFIGALMGLFIGVIWLLIMRRINSLPFSYILTLAVVLFTYAFSEILGGNGALSALLFGLVLGNELQIFSFFKFNCANQTIVGDGLRRFESEIAFLVRTFFFVFLGIIATISNSLILFVGIILSLLLYVIRYASVWLSTIKCEIRRESMLMSAILNRGLAAAVLATLPAQYGLEYSDLFINMAVVVIVTTTIISTISILKISINKPSEN
jgi:cell volume regulation protein A